MDNCFKRFLSLALAVLMVVSCVPAEAFATEIVEVDSTVHEHYYEESIVADATCTEAGTVAYTCSCEDSYTEEIPANGHNFVDGACTVCGEADPEYVAPTEETEAPVVEETEAPAVEETEAPEVEETEAATEVTEAPVVEETEAATEATEAPTEETEVELNFNGIEHNEEAVEAPVAMIGETGYATITEAIAAAQNGETVVIMPGEYSAIDISNKNITIAGTVGDNGELLTTIKGGNPAITGHGFNGTIKDINIVDAWKVMYAEPAGNVTVDNVYVTGATYGFHLIAYSEGLTWTIQNSYMDLSWANSFGVYGGDAEIVIKGNEFAATNPYYPDYGALPVNTFLPNVTVQENIFGENTKISLSVTDTSKVDISKNYHADGVDNAFVSDSDATVSINEYYADAEMTDLVKRYAQIGDVYYASLAEAAAAAQAGDEIILLGNVTEDVTLPAGVIFNGNGKTVNGTVKAGGDLTFTGNTTITTFSAGWYGNTITIGEGASLKVTGGRVTVSYGNVFNITGSVVDAKTADKTAIKPSLEIVSGLSFNGDGDGVQFNVTNAYIVLGDSSTKNSGATGEFNMNFDNSIVDFTKTLKTYMPTADGLAPEFNLAAENSVVNFASHMELWLDETTMTLDNTDMTVGGSFANAGAVEVKNDASFVVKAPIMSSHGGNTGSINVTGGSFELKDSNQAWENAGSMSVSGDGKLVINDFKNTGEGSVAVDATGMKLGDSVADFFDFGKDSAIGFTNVIVKGLDDGNVVVNAEGELAERNLTEDNGVYLINDLTDLKLFAKKVNAGDNFSGKTVKLTADIDLNNEEWTPIGYMGKTFKGIFDGGNYTIKNLKITKELGNTSANNGIGLFGRTDDTAVIQNLTIENVDITGSLYVGAVVGYGYTGNKVENVTVKGDIAIDAWWYAGVIGGNGYMSLVNNCHVIGNSGSYIKGNDGSYIGGIWGFRGEGNNKITNCSVTGLEITSVDRVGGICGIGHYGNTVSDCDVENVTISATDPDATTVGLIVGACQGTESEPTVFSGNAVDNVTAKAGDKVVTGFYGTNINGSVPATNIVAEINSVPFESLQSAAAAAQAGDEIVLLKDATVDSTLALPAGITLTSNGHTVNGSIRMLGDLTLNGDLTITGGLWVGKSGETLTATLSGDKLTASYFMFQHGTYTIDADIDAVYGYLSYSGTFQVNSTIHTTGTNGEVLYINGNVTLNDGAVLDSDNSVFVCNEAAVLTLNPGSKVDSNVKLTVAGATLSSAGDITGTISVVDGAKASISGGTYSVDVTAWCAEGYVCVEKDDGTFGVKAAQEAWILRNNMPKFYATLAEAIADAQPGETIMLCANIEVDERITINKNLTISDYGTLTVSFTGNSGITIVNDAEVTLDNFNIDISRAKAAGDAIFCIGNYSNNAELNLVDMNVTGNGYSSAYAVFYVYNTSELNIEGGNYTLSNDKASSGGFIKAEQGKDGIVNITDSKISLTDAKIGFLDGTVKLDGTTLNIKGGANAINQSALTVIDSTITVDGADGRALTLSQGDVTVVNSTLNFSNCSEGEIRFKKGLSVTADGDSNISDCTVYADASAVDVANINGQIITGVEGNESELVGGTVVNPEWVAKIGTTYYMTLQDALKALTADDVLTLVSDVTITENWDCRYTGAKITVPVTIDGNGKTIKFTSTVDDKNHFAAFRFEADATVKNLKVDMSEATNTNNRVRAISAKANLTVVDCEFIGNPAVTNSRAIIFGEGSGTAIGDVTVSVTGSTFTNWTKGLGDNENAQDVKSVTATGNTFNNSKVALSADGSVTFTGNTVIGAEVVITSHMGTIDTVVVADNTLNDGAIGSVSNADSYADVQSDFIYNVPATIVRDGETVYFNTLAAAIADAKNGETVVLMKDGIKENVTIVQAPDKVITIDGAGHTFKGTITVDGKSAAYATAGTVIKNINFVAASGAVCINLGKSGDNNTRYTSNVTVQDCTFTGTDKTACGIKSYTGGDKNLTVTGCDAIGMHSLMQLKNVVGVKVSGCTITDSKNGIALGKSHEAVVTGCIVDVTGYGVRADADSETADAPAGATISGSVINASQPVVIRNVAIEYDLTVGTENTFTAPEGNAAITFTAGDDGVEAETPNVAVNLYGDLNGIEVFPAHEAKIGNTYYPTFEDAVTKAADCATIDLLADIEASEVILIDKSLTINGNGHMVTSSATRVFRLTTSNIDVTLNNVNMVSSAKVVYPNDVRGISIDASLSNVKMTLNDCSVDFTDASANDWAYAVNVSGNGTGHTVTVSGGTYEGANVINVNGANNTVVVKDAILNCQYPNNDQYAGACIWVLQNQNSSVEATGNTFNGSNAVAFNLGTGTKLTESANTDNTKYVVAKVGNTYYHTLAEAFAAAVDGDTVKLLQNVKIDSETYTIADGVTITFDMNGKKLTVADNKTSNYELFYIYGGLTVTGNGTIELTSTNNRGWNAMSAIFHNRGGVLTIENGTFKNLGGTDMAWVVDNSGNWYGDATTTILDGELSSTYTAIRNRMEQNTHSASGKAILNISGGTITGTTSAIWAQAASTSTTAPATGEINISGGEIGLINTARSAGAESMTTITGGTVAAFKGEVNELQVVDPDAITGELIILDADGNETAYVIDAEGRYIDAPVKIGTTGYKTLAEAFTAANDGDEVVIMQAGTYALSTSGKNITITGKVEGVVFDNIGACGMGGANVTFNNVTFDYYPNVNYTGLQHSGNLVYNNCTFEGQVFLYGASETFNNCTFNQTSSDAYNVWTYGAKEVEFIGCTFNSAGKSVLIYAESADIFNDVTVTDCDFNASTVVADKAAIEMDSSLTAGIKLTIDGETTVTGFGTGNVSGNSLWNNKKGNEGANNDIIVTVDGEVVLQPIKTASIGNVYYTTINAALNAANAGDTVNIYAGNYTQNLDVKKGITVVGETDAEGNNLVNITGKLNITADGAAVKNINVVNTSTACYVGAKNVLIEGCELTGSNGLYQSYTSGTVTFKDSTITGGTYGIHFDGSKGGNIVIDNCIITGWTSFAATITNVAISDTEFKSGNYNQLRFYQNAQITDTTFPAKMRIDAGKSGLVLTVDDCKMADGSDLAEVFPSGTLAKSEVIVNGERLMPVCATVDGAEYRDLQKAIDAATDGATVTMVYDVALTEGVTVPAGKTITLDLNGKVISMADASAATVALLKNQGNLTIKDSSEAKSGKLTFNTTTPSAANAYASNTISNYGVLTIESGNIENTGLGGACYALDNYAGSTATIKDGNLTAEKTAVRVFNWTNGEAAKAVLNVEGGTILSKDGYGINFNMGNTPTAELNISGGTITTEDTDYNLAVYAYCAGQSAEKLNVNISAGTFNGDVAIYDASNKMVEGAVTVTGGTFNGAYGVFTYAEKDTNNALVITGGAYNTVYVDQYLEEGFTLNYNGGAFCVTPDSVAFVGGEIYGTIQAAVEAAQAGDTILLLDEVSLKTPVVIDKNITLDLNGMTINGNGVYPVIRVQGGADVTVKNGNINNTDYVFVLGAQDASSAGNLTIESGNYVGVTTVASVTKGTLTITGGDFSVDESEYGATYLLNCYDPSAKDGSAKIVVSGGTFHGFNPANNAAENPKINFCAEGYIAAENGNVYTVVVDSVATINDVGYDTVAAALAAAKSGDTVKVMKNAKESYVVITPGITLDLNGNTLEATYVYGAKGSNLVDNSEANTGLLVTDKNSVGLSASNAQLPVWDSENGGYIFAEVSKINNKWQTELKYIFQPLIEQDAHDLLKLGTDVSGVKIAVRISWKDAANNADISKNMIYNDSFVETYLNSYNQNGTFGKMFTLTMKEKDASYQITAVVYSDTGVEVFPK